LAAHFSLGQLIRNEETQLELATQVAVFVASVGIRRLPIGCCVTGERASVGKAREMMRLCCFVKKKQERKR
jgi:hypothetical protein